MFSSDIDRLGTNLVKVWTHLAELGPKTAGLRSIVANVFSEQFFGNVGATLGTPSAFARVTSRDAWRATAGQLFGELFCLP